MYLSEFMNEKTVPFEKTSYGENISFTIKRIY